MGMYFGPFTDDWAHPPSKPHVIHGGSGGVGGDHSHHQTTNKSTVNHVSLVNAKAAFWLAWGAVAWQALEMAAPHLR